MNKRAVILLFCFLGFSGFHWWDPIAKWVGIGNKAIEQGNIEEAKNAYSNVEKINSQLPELKFNQGIADIVSEETDNAVEHFKSAYAAAESNELKAKALYNKGIAEAKLQKYENALNSFKTSLKLDPNDEDAKANLELVRKYLQMQQMTPQPQQQQDKNQENDQDQNDEEQSNQSENRQQNQDQNQSQSTASPTPQNNEERNQNSNDAKTPTPTPSAQTQPVQTSAPAENKTPSPQPQMEEGKMSEQEAQRILDAMEEEEMEVLKRFHQLPQPEGRIEKDW